MMRDQPSQTLSRQRIRRSTQLGFFALFLAAPALNLLRFDLNTVQLWFLGQPWSLGIDRVARSEVSATHAAIDVFVRGFLPGLALVLTFLWVARMRAAELLGSFSDRTSWAGPAAQMVACVLSVLPAAGDDLGHHLADLFVAAKRNLGQPLGGNADPESVALYWHRDSGFHG